MNLFIIGVWVMLLAIILASAFSSTNTGGKNNINNNILNKFLFESSK